jgi:hypothetical protein
MIINNRAVSTTQNAADMSCEIGLQLLNKGRSLYFFGKQGDNIPFVERLQIVTWWPKLLTSSLQEEETELACLLERSTHP